MRPLGLQALDPHAALRAVQAVAVEQGGGRTALHVAAEFGHLAATRLLLEHGMSVEARDACGETALHLAARHGHVDVARLLLAAGADRATRDGLGQRPDTLAHASGHASLANLLAVAPPRAAAPSGWWHVVRRCWRRFWPASRRT